MSIYYNKSYSVRRTFLKSEKSNSLSMKKPFTKCKISKRYIDFRHGEANRSNLRKFKNNVLN